MRETEHEIFCQNCRSAIPVRHTFYLELNTPDEWEALAAFAAGACTPTDCPECAHENTKDFPVSVYDPQINRMYYYMPAINVAGMDLTELFEFGGDATATLVGVVFEHLRSAGALDSGGLEYGLRQESFSFRVFFSPIEVFHQAVAGAQIAEAHHGKAEMYKLIEPPADFLERGSRMYKRNKLKFIYCLGQGFEEGRTYSESDVDHVILHERRYLRENQIDGSHARVALVELGILERTSCGSLYWRKPEAGRIHGLKFPSHVEGFEKSGYTFYDEPNLGFSVCYRRKALESTVTFYVYGAPDLEMSSKAIETEFSNTRDGVLMHFESEGRTPKILEEKRLTIDKHDGRAETVCHLTMRITDPDGTAHRSHVLLTAWEGRYIKVRMTSPDTIVGDDELLSRLVTALFKKMAVATALPVSAVD
jgi:hypothetical protein